MHTKGPWRIGKAYGAVVADHPSDGAFSGSDHVEAYGGHLIGESISEHNRPLISAAPDLFDSALAFVLHYDAGGKFEEGDLRKFARAFRAAVDKACGESSTRAREHIAAVKEEKERMEARDVGVEYLNRAEVVSVSSSPVKITIPDQWPWVREVVIEQEMPIEEAKRRFPDSVALQRVVDQHADRQTAQEIAAQIPGVTTAANVQPSPRCKCGGVHGAHRKGCKENK